MRRRNSAVEMVWFTGSVISEQNWFSKKNQISYLTKSLNGWTLTIYSYQKMEGEMGVDREIILFYEL